MGYTDAVKKQILTQKIKSACCRKAFICGLFFDRLFDSNNNDIKFRLGDFENFELCVDIIFKHFHFKTDIVTSTVCGRREYAIYLPSGLVSKLFNAHNAENMSDSGNSGNSTDILDLRCPQCAQSFLGGAFVAYATVQDPRTRAGLEFNLKNPEAISLLRTIIDSQGFVSQGKSRLYFKKAEQVSSFLATIGAKKLSFDLMNIQIERDIRNYENRVTNCLTRNITRSISAAMIQIEAITSLMDRGLFETLADELKDTARLRLENPDVSLTELAEMHEPPITKSGLSHRLAKLVEVSGIKQ